MGNIVLYNVYLLPEMATWSGELDRDPCLVLASSTPSIQDPPRNSKDTKPPSTRGRFLFRLCNDYDLVFVSGAERFGPSSGEYTSFQGTRNTVIDYVICSRTLFPDIKAFKVEPRIPGFDHAPLVLQLRIYLALILGRSVIPSRKRKREPVALQENTELDRMLIETLEAGKDEAKKSSHYTDPCSR